MEPSAYADFFEELFSATHEESDADDDDLEGSFSDSDEDYDAEDDNSVPLIPLDFHIDYDEKMSEYHTTLNSCSSKRSWRLSLIDGPHGWMSPRMRELLQTTAEVASDDCHGDDGYYGKFIPHSASRHVGGFLYIVGKIAETMQSGKLPTTENVLEKVYGGYESWEYRGPAKRYLESGGRVEHAIDGLLRMAQVSVEDGEFDEILESQERLQELPLTPFDQDFDLVRIMCLDRDCFNNATRRRSGK